MTVVPDRLIGSCVAAATSTAAYRLGRRNPPGGAARWTRTNHRGESLTLLGGPSVAVGSLVGTAIAPGLPTRLRCAALLAGGTAAVLGAYDDLAGGADAKGLRGHLGSLARGQLTTGSAKLVGIGAAGLVAGGLTRPRGSGPTDRLVAGVLVAGTANLVNLLDLRPGRATKAVVVAALPALVRGGSGGDCLAPPVGAALALLAPDLAEQTMLGDAGANCLGALLGVAAAAGLRRRRSLFAATAVVSALTLASERVSFTAVIESTPGLREFDAWGRRPVTGPTP